MLYSLWFRRYAPFAEFGFGFEGDKRTAASTSFADTARTSGGCSFGPDAVGPGYGTSSGTRHKLSSTSAISKVTSSVAVATRTLSIVRFTAMTAGANPMVPGAPEIDTFVDLSASFSSSAITVEGTVRGDTFPNAEVFVIDGAGKAILLWDYATTGGQDTGPMTRLAGSHSTTTLGTFSVRLPIKPSGAFT